MSKVAKITANLVETCKVAAVKSTPAFKKFMYYAKVELTPPSVSDIPAIRNGIKNLVTSVKTKRYLEVPVREAWLNTLVTIEVLCWFFIGECIGKRHLIGYKV